MAAKARGRGGKGGISPRALVATVEDEAPGPGVERKPQVGIAGAGSPTGAASKKKGRARFEELLRCPLCGKLVRRHSAPFHALAHLERLERRGVLQLSRENGGWVVVLDARARRAKYTGAGWTTLLKVAEMLGARGENA